MCVCVCESVRAYVCVWGGGGGACGRARDGVRACLCVYVCVCARGGVGGEGGSGAELHGGAVPPLRRLVEL